MRNRKLVIATILSCFMVSSGGGNFVYASETNKSSSENKKLGISEENKKILDDLETADTELLSKCEEKHKEIEQEISRYGIAQNDYGSLLHVLDVLRLKGSFIGPNGGTFIASIKDMLPRLTSKDMIKCVVKLAGNKQKLQMLVNGFNDYMSRLSDPQVRIAYEQKFRDEFDLGVNAFTRREMFETLMATVQLCPPSTPYNVDVLSSCADLYGTSQECFGTLLSIFRTNYGLEPYQIFENIRTFLIQEQKLKGAILDLRDATNKSLEKYIQEQNGTWKKFKNLFHGGNSEGKKLDRAFKAKKKDLMTAKNKGKEALQ